ncbi:MAG: hypothetical protein QT03_C0001G0250 [archaeon GW2011_AR10]|nr:MAG: hypothetical protein QT03_C0001G0250 [archaeon GW2011_AR10]
MIYGVPTAPSVAPKLEYWTKLYYAPKRII